ncbi:MAG TPA: prepilin-type N-terminal cleavage/methylation domain-containing protein [Acidimicrobiia bacterium]
MKRISSEQGFTLVELLTVVLIMAVLVAIAIPTFVGHVNQARDTSAKGELRDLLPAVKSVIADPDPSLGLESNVKAVSPSAPLDSSAVDGIKLQASPDDDVCMWRISDSGKVYGIWEPGSGVGLATLYGEFTTLPAGCPILADAPDIGFAAELW